MNPGERDVQPKASLGIQGVGMVFDGAEAITKTASFTKAATSGLKMSVGVLGIVSTTVEFIEDAQDGVSWGDGAKVMIGVGTTAAVVFAGPIIGGAAVIYGITDFALEAYTGHGLNDRIGAGIDNILK